MPLAEFYRNKKVLITGHTGFKGSWLTQILFSYGAKVVGYSLKPETEPNLFTCLKIQNKITNYFGDIRNYDYLKEVFQKEKPEIVFHLAAQPLVRESYDHPIYTFETNVLGTVNVLQAIKEVGCIKSAVLITTDKVYENKEGSIAYKEEDKLGGHDPYSSSKACAELIISSYRSSFFNPKKYGAEHNTLIASTRSGNVIGGGDWSKDRLVPDIVKSFIKSKDRLIVRSPKSIRPWQHVLEPLYGYLLLGKKLFMESKEHSGAWNFAPPESNCLEVETIVKTAMEVLRAGSYVIEEDTTKPETKILKLNADKAKDKLNWLSLLNFRETLDWTFEWYRKFYDGEDMEQYTQKQIEEFFKRIRF